jgi:hypothetical protein
MTLPIDEGVWINLQSPIDGPHPIEILVEYVDDELMLHCLHCNEAFHMELSIAERIRNLQDISENDWFSCGNNAYWLGEKSLSLLEEIDSENGLIKDRCFYGKEIPEFWKKSKEYQGLII